VSGKCPGLHCPGCGDGGGGLAVVLVVLAVIAAAGYHVRHGIETGLEIVMWSIVGAAGLAVAGGLVYAGLRIRASVRARQPRTVIPARAEIVQLRAELFDPPAIEAPRPRAASWPLPGQWDEINPSTERSRPWES
jgi:hypothetical protein